jgi:hypothetical protein
MVMMMAGPILQAPDILHPEAPRPIIPAIDTDTRGVEGRVLLEDPQSATALG